jgi:hypothetical protein
VAEVLAALAVRLVQQASQVFLVEVAPRPRAPQRLASRLLLERVRAAVCLHVPTMAQSP